MLPAESAEQEPGLHAGLEAPARAARERRDTSLTRIRKEEKPLEMHGSRMWHILKGGQRSPQSRSACSAGLRGPRAVLERRPRFWALTRREWKLTLKNIIHDNARPWSAVKQV